MDAHQTSLKAFKHAFEPCPGLLNLCFWSRVWHKLQGYSEGQAGLRMDPQSCGNVCRMSSMTPLSVFSRMFRAIVLVIGFPCVTA